MARTHSERDLLRLLTQLEARRVFRAGARELERFVRRGWIRDMGWVPSAPPERKSCVQLFEVVDRYLIRRLEERLTADPALASELFVRTLSALERANLLKRMFGTGVVGFAKRKPAESVKKRRRMAAGARLKFALRRRFPLGANLEFEALAEAATASDDPKVAEALWTDELVASVREVATTLEDATNGKSSEIRSESSQGGEEARIMDLEEVAQVVEEEASPGTSDETHDAPEASAGPAEPEIVETAVEEVDSPGTAEDFLLDSIPAPVVTREHHHAQPALTADEFTALAEPTESRGSPFEAGTPDGGDVAPAPAEAIDQGSVPTSAPELEEVDLQAHAPEHAQAEHTTPQVAFPLAEGGVSTPITTTDPGRERWEALERQLEKISVALERATENLAKQLQTPAPAPALAQPVPEPTAVAPASPPPALDPTAIRDSLAPLVDKLGEQAATQQRGNVEIATALGKLAADLEALPRQLAAVTPQVAPPRDATQHPPAPPEHTERRSILGEPTVQLGAVSVLATGWALVFWTRLAAPTLAAVALGIAIVAAGFATWSHGRGAKPQRDAT